MYHSSTPWGAQFPWTAGFSWTMHLVPKGAIGVRLKSYGPFSIASAAMRGLSLDGRRRLRVKFVWSKRRSQSCSGNCGWRPQRMDMKWFFHVLIALSAAFARWRCGGTSWNMMPFFVITCINSFEHSLSRISNSGLSPRSVKYSYSRACAFAIDLAVLSFIGSATIAFAS